MTIKVDNSHNTQKLNSGSSKTPSGNYTVSAGETLYSLMKKFNFKNEAEIREYLKMTDTEQLKKGQILNFPTKKVETTLTALAKKYNLTLQELLVLNPQIKEPAKVKKGTPVNVPIRPFSKEADKSKFSQPSAKSIAEDLKKSSSDFGAVTGEKFKKAFEKLNAGNIKDVIMAYNEISPKESLIKMICREISNSKDSRKTAVMKIYDLLAQTAGDKKTTAAKRAAFKAELDKEFNSWGLVSTEKLDKMINELINNKSFSRITTQHPQPESKPQQQNTYYNKYIETVKNGEHKVKKGESLGSIAKKYNVSIEEIKKLNNLTSKHITQVGDILKIPDTKKFKNINTLSDTANALGLSESFILSLKRSEDGTKMGDNEFHLKPYKDKNGNWTIGIGHLITDSERSKYLGKTLSVSQVCTLFAEDVKVVSEQVKELIGEKAYNNMPQTVKDAVTDYMFNRGQPILKRQTDFVNALKSQNWAKAISLINVDYSFKRDKNGRLVKDKKGHLERIYLSGLSKRRLFDMYMACKMYRGNIPQEIKNAIQNMYNRGLYHMQTEFKNAKEREAVHRSFNAEVKGWFGDLIQYK